VSALEVSHAITSSNVNVPGGQIDTGPSHNTLRITGRVLDPQELCRIVIREQGNNQIRVADVVVPPANGKLGDCVEDAEKDDQHDRHRDQREAGQGRRDPASVEDSRYLGWR